MLIWFLILFFQLFNNEAEAEVTLKNTGKVGFEFCIVHPQRGDEAEESQRKIHEGVRQDPLLREPPSAGVKKQVRPGQPMFIPNRVSSTRIGGSLVKELFLITCFLLYVSRVT